MDFVSIGGGIGNTHRNAPAVILTFLTVFSVVGTFVAITTLGQPLLRDAELGADELFFLSPMRKGGYLWGRLSAGLSASLIVYAIMALAIGVGTFMPWLDPQRLGPFSLRPYLWVLGVIIVPNLIFLGALMSLLAVTTRRLLGVVLVGSVSSSCGSSLSRLRATSSTTRSFRCSIPSRRKPPIARCGTGRSTSATRSCRS